MLSEQLNQEYAIDGHLRIVEGKGGLPMIEVDNGRARATISVYAGQVLSYQPAGESEDLLFVSHQAYFQDGKAIKGGVPVCWPWFGADPEGKGRAAHGFVRNRMWTLVTTEATPEGDTRIVLALMDNDDTRAIWPHAFYLTLEITVGETLSLALVTRNAGEESFPLTQALHTYFAIGNIRQLEVLGLEGRHYLDKAAGAEGSEQTQIGAVTVDKEVDRIYLDVPSELEIHDPVFGRRINISSKGNNTAVVWNPWEKIAAEMGDLEDDDYLRFICVETTNAADDVVNVAPDNEYRLEVVYKITQG